MPDSFVPTTVFAPRPANGQVGGDAAGGAASETQIRLSGNIWYGDGTGASVDGADRGNPRAISNAVFKQTDANGVHIDKPNEGGFSSLLWVWGQFLDHDLDQTDSNGAVAGSAPIPVPAGDPVYGPAGVTSLSFNRSLPDAGTGVGGAPREFSNEITAFIDASMVYGSSQAKLDALLMPGTAKLHLTASGTIDFASNHPIFSNGAIAGDTRAGENAALLSMQALFAREHNRIVDDIVAAVGTSMSTAQIFQAARARVEATIQAITYNEFLPILIGAPLPTYVDFDPTVNPAISLEFSTAVYRLGHTLLSPSIFRINEDGSTVTEGNLALRDAFGNRGAVEQTGIDAILRGMSTTKSQELDTFVVEDVRSFLFNPGPPGSPAVGQDLAALNIQRGRDHGLPSYMEMRAFLGLPLLTNFSQITTDADVVNRLRTAYGDDLGRIDLWVGGLAEDPVLGGMVGPTFRAVLVDQFMRLRAGDPFWSQARDEFSAAELDELWSTTLSDVIKRNSDVDNLQDSAFHAYLRTTGGTAGADTMNGTAGERNLISGNDGDDILIGREMDDHLVGGAGADRLEARGGSNVLAGGTEADTYVIDVSVASYNTIRGWQQAIDILELLNASGVSAPSVVDGPDGAVVTFGQAVMLFEGVEAADLPPFSGETPPSANPDAGVVIEDGSVTINVLTNDEPDDGPLDPASVQFVGADASSGGKTKTVAGQGIWQVNPNGSITFTPAPGYTGGVTDVAYTVADDDGDRSAPATVSVTIMGSGGAPIANPDAGTAPVNGTGTINVLANDTDDGPLDLGSVALEGADAGSNGRTKTVAGQGVWTVNATTGAISFASVANFNGAVTAAAYTVADQTGLRSSAAVVALTLTGGLNPGQTLTGDGNANTQTGGTGNDTINGNGGNDTQNGAGGNDVLNGGSGTDTSNGGGGNDLFLITGTEAQTDTINGGAGLSDTIRAVGGGAVTLNGTQRISNVEIFEGGGREVVGTNGADTLDFSIFAAVSGVTAINGGNGNDTITGTRFADVLIGGSGNDILNGGDGGDQLTGRAGIDVVNGGNGDDVIFIRTDMAVTDTMNGGEGTDTIRLDSTAADVVLAGTSRISGIEIYEGGGRAVLGTGAADVFDFTIFTSVTGVTSIQGLDGNDTIVGSDGNDVILGGSGSDTLNGARGNDTLTGGANNDTFRFVVGVTAGINTITDFDQDGNDVLRFVGYSFGSGNPGSLTNVQRAAAVGGATAFDLDGTDATVDLGELGGEGSIRLLGVNNSTLTFNIEDIVFG